jgi:hypothetical protein
MAKKSRETLKAITPKLAEWVRNLREVYNLPLGDPSLIQIFKDIVQAGFEDEKDTIELPTELLIKIVGELDSVRKAGRPSKSWDVKTYEFFAIIKGREQIREWKSKGVPPDEALERAAREVKCSPKFKKIALSTIKSRLQRRTYR